MSMEDLMKFMTRVQEDESVSRKIKEIAIHDLQGLVIFGNELGLFFTVEELEEAQKNALRTRQELSEEDLDAASAGETGFVTGLLCPTNCQCIY